MLYSNSLTFKLQKLQFVLRQLQLGAWCLGAFFQFQVHKMNFTILQLWLLVFDILIDMQILICWGCVITPVSALSMVTVARAGCLRDSPPRVFGATSPRGSGSEAIKLWWEGREGFARVSIFHYDHMKLALVPGGPGQPLLAAGHRRSYGAVIKNTPRQHLATSIFYLMDWPRGCLMCHMS